ncbi:hypothetical protein POTOM_053989 [Populus tomentosa]|uniref:DNA-directed RNA polymerase N-terminal domain-containing protein n=1 Tax=Populus tomentosa TaxID=118781 RepID=A0A8X8C531_POPTO|nr:hypothetical protein POTOM_053989 [Populus tomentosa]
MWRNVAKQATLKSQSKFIFLRNSDSTNGNRCGGFCPRGYVSAAEAVSSTDVEDNVSGADEVQELLPEMRKGEEKEEHFRRRRLHANPGIGSRKHRVLRRRQVKIEAEAWELATKEYKELLKDIDAIAKEQELIGTGKSRQGYAPYFDLLPADKMSFIAMHELAAMVMTVDWNGEHGCARVVTAACMVGDAIEQQVIFTLSPSSSAVHGSREDTNVATISSKHGHGGLIRVTFNFPLSELIPCFDIVSLWIYTFARSYGAAKEQRKEQRTDLAVAGFGLLFWPLLLEVEWRGEGGQLMVAETPLQGWSGGDEEDNEIAAGGLGSGEAGVDGDGGAAVLVLMRRRGDSV